MINETAQIERKENTTKNRDFIECAEKDISNVLISNKQCQTRTIRDKQRARKAIIKKIETELEGHEITEEEVNTVGKALYELSQVFQEVS